MSSNLIYLQSSGYGEINYRDRALIVTILLAIVILLRLIQIVLSFAIFRRRSAKPTLFITREHGSPGAHLSRRGEFTTQA